MTVFIDRQGKPARKLKKYQKKVSPTGTRLAHPGWTHFDIDFDDENTIICQYCLNRYDRSAVLPVLLGHIMVVHSDTNCYAFKKSAGFFAQKRVLFKLGKDNPYFDAIDDKTVSCRWCAKTHTNAEVSRLLTHLQQTHGSRSFNDFRADVLAHLDAGSIGSTARIKREKQEPGETLSSSATFQIPTWTPSAPAVVNNNFVDDKSTIVRVHHGDATSSSVNPGTAAAPIQSELPPEVSDGEDVQPRRKIANKKAELTRSRYNVRIVTNRMAQKWRRVGRMHPYEFEQPKNVHKHDGYGTNGCYKQYFKCHKHHAGCPFRMIAVNNKHMLKLYQYRHHNHTV
uniref:BED-type domain-containing protein n=1 Tax=Panagrellus redivivus TaxID=6233 RepID=A0A7E4VXT1_PANRE